MFKIINFKRCFFFLPFILSTLLVGCSSSDDGPTNNSDEFIIANVETLSFKSSNMANGVTAAKIDGGDSITYIVQGFDDAGNAIVLFVANFDGTGTYDLSFDEENNGTSGLFSNQSTAWSSVGGQGGTGTITVLTDDSDETTGRFEFVGVQADNTSSRRTVTNGSFRAKY